MTKETPPHLTPPLSAPGARYDSAASASGGHMLPPADGIDENLLLAETEELLAALDATAFIASPLSTEDDEDEDDGDYEYESSPAESESVQLVAIATAAHHTRALTALAPLAAAALPTTDTAIVAAPKAGKKRIRSRDRTKDELVELRRSVVEMEQHLVALRRNTTVAGKGRATISKTWENIAKRQLCDRQRAEAENAHLKAMLLGQLSLAGRFDQTSNKRQLIALPIAPLSSEAQTKRARIAGEDQSDAVMEAIIGDLDRLHAEMNAVFEECGISQWRHEASSYAQTKSESVGDAGESRTFIELVEMRMIPFNVRAVGNYMWQSMKSWHHKNNTYAYACRDRPDDTFAVSYHVKANGDEDKYAATFKLAKRRYVMEDGLMVIWKSRSVGESDLAGYYTDEVGWVVMSHAPPVDDETPATTSLRACLRIYPQKAAEPPSSSPSAVTLAYDDAEEADGSSTGTGTGLAGKETLLANLVVGSFEDDVNSINQTLENLLLEEARALDQSVDTKGLVKNARIHFESTE